MIQFSKIVDSLGEWPGSKYIPRKPGYPKLEILVAHFPEKGYVRYTKMAYSAARRKMEYWSKVKQMFEYTLTRPIIEKLMKDSIYMFPFRFVEFDSGDNIIENSGLTILDFETLSNPISMHITDKTDCNYQIAYELTSSLPDKKMRVKVLSQAKNILIKQGMKENNIKLDYRKQKQYMNYIIYFKNLCI